MPHEGTGVMGVSAFVCCETSGVMVSVAWWPGGAGGGKCPPNGA